MSDVTWTNEKRKLRDLVPWDRNPRQIRRDEAERLLDSLKTFGQVQMIAVGPDSEIYDGHQRNCVWAAAEAFGPDFEVDVRASSRPLTEKEREKLVVYLHRGTVAEWDWDALENEFEMDELLDWGFTEFDLQLGGIEIPEPEPPEDPGPQLDRAAELQERWGTATGQIWRLGDHRLAVGDCTDRAVVEGVLFSEQPFMTVTDPPYGVEYDPEWRQKAAEAGFLAYAATRVGVVKNDDCADWTAAFKLSPSSVAYCWQDALRASSTQQMLEAAGFGIRSQIIWSKPHFPISRGNYHWRHEPCWYAVRKNASAHWIGDRKQTTVWEIALDKNVDGGHSTQKPVECMARPIRNHSGDVYDPFVGTGTTIIAAEHNRRRCFAVDIDPAYCAVAIQRWHDMTGREPKLLEG